MPTSLSTFLSVLFLKCHICLSIYCKICATASAILATTPPKTVFAIMLYKASLANISTVALLHRHNLHSSTHHIYMLYCCLYLSGLQIAIYLLYFCPTHIITSLMLPSALKMVILLSTKTDSLYKDSPNRPI